MKTSYMGDSTVSQSTGYSQVIEAGALPKAYQQASPAYSSAAMIARNNLMNFAVQKYGADQNAILRGIQQELLSIGRQHVGTVVGRLLSYYGQTIQRADQFQLLISAGLPK